MFETGISVACEVTKGLFMSEYYIRILNKDEILWQGIVDKEMVIDVSVGPEAEKFIKGRLYAYLISVDGDNAVIELPVENSLVGRRISVPLGLLRRERVPA